MSERTLSNEARPRLRVSRTGDPDRVALLSSLCRRAEATPAEVENAARRLLDDVRARGDAAVREATERFEKRRLDRFELGREEWAREADRTAPDVAKVIERAWERILKFHQAEAARLMGSGYALDENTAGGGHTHLALHLRPLARVGLYAPGGTARYPSTVLMTAAPATAAGVGELILVTPGPSPETLHAARVAGVHRVFQIGGAQAVGALAYGTETVPRVDKIVGPGNAYVAAAKRLVFGQVDIDQVAGPSEVLIVADEHAGRADYIAADLLAQAEHDTEAYAVLVTTSEALAVAVAHEVDKQLAVLPREAIASESIRRHGAAVVVGSLDEARAFANDFAPEHLELEIAGITPELAVAEYVNAGAIFLGAATEALGDYYAGPNHVLPTAGSARFSSPLGVHDFIKRTSVVSYDRAALVAQAADVVRFAGVEGLDAHGRSVAIRVPELGSVKGQS